MHESNEKVNFHKYVIYQIYPKSFCDTKGDGLGDLRGIIEKIPYIASLGVDMVWFNPFFAHRNATMAMTSQTTTPSSRTLAP